MGKVKFIFVVVCTIERKKSFAKPNFRWDNDITVLKEAGPEVVSSGSG